MGGVERDKESGGASEGDHRALRKDPTSPGEQVTNELPWEGLDGSAKQVRRDSLLLNRTPAVSLELQAMAWARGRGEDGRPVTTVETWMGTARSRTLGGAAETAPGGGDQLCHLQA